MKEIKSKRETVLVCQLYLEFVIDEIIRAYFCYPNNRKQGQWIESQNICFTSFNNKLRILDSLGILEKEQMKTLYNIKDTRNSVSHDLLFENVKYEGKDISESVVLEKFKSDTIKLWTELNGLWHVILENPNLASEDLTKIKKPNIVYFGRIDAKLKKVE